MSAIKLLIIGTGNIANIHMMHYKRDTRVEVVAAVEPDAGRLKAFCQKHGIAKSFASLEKAIAWGAFDVAANCTPDQIHHPTTLALIAAKKHILCEKPLAPNHQLAQEMTAAGEKAGLINMVNLSYRDVPALSKARALIEEGAIGDIRHVEASYRQSWLVGNHWGDWSKEELWLWRLSQEHGSRGVLGDVGIHILDFVVHATGMLPETMQARLATFHKAPGDKIGPYKLDANDSAVMSVSFANGALGVIHASRFMTGYANTLRLEVFGTKGAVEVEHGVYTKIRLCTGEDIHTQAWRDVRVEPVYSNYHRFISAVLAKQQVDPDFRYATELQAVLDRCYDRDCSNAPII